MLCIFLSPLTIHECHCSYLDQPFHLTYSYVTSLILSPSRRPSSCAQAPCQHVHHTLVRLLVRWFVFSICLWVLWELRPLFSLFILVYLEPVQFERMNKLHSFIHSFIQNVYFIPKYVLIIVATTMKRHCALLKVLILSWGIHSSKWDCVVRYVIVGACLGKQDHPSEEDLSSLGCWG